LSPDWHFWWAADSRDRFVRITNRPGLHWAYDSAALPLAAYVGRFGWLALLRGAIHLDEAWRELRQMAALDGASPLRVALGVRLAHRLAVAACGVHSAGRALAHRSPRHRFAVATKPAGAHAMLMTWVHMARFDPMIEASLLMVFLVLAPVAAAMLLVIVARRKLRERLSNQTPHDHPRKISARHAAPSGRPS
jgi:hypothetical protein